MKKGHKILLIVLAFVVLLLLGLARDLERTPAAEEPTLQAVTEETGPVVHIGDALVSVAIADTPDLRRKGLSGHDPLEPNTGMLFIFDAEGLYGFWMKDMRFSIDIIWFDTNGRVVHVVEGATPESFPAIFEPATPARYVLEVPAGFVHEENIRVGDRVTFAAR